MCVYIYPIEKERDFKDLTHMIVDTGKSKICRVGLQAEDQGEG